MVQELARVQCGTKLKREEKGPLGATMVLYFQKDDISNALVCFINLVCYVVKTLIS